MHGVGGVAASELRFRTPTFAGDRGFLRDVRSRVDAALGDTPRAGDPALWRKVGVILLWFGLSYVGLLTLDDPVALVALCVSMGLSASALGLNLFHDANHGGLSRHPAVNRWAARAASALLGASNHFWRRKHHVLHHRFTNLHTWDDDVETRGTLRMSPHQPWRPWHAVQHLTFPLLYALNTIEWFFVKDFVQYATRRLNPYQRVPPLRPAEHLEFWACKAVYLALFVALPLAAQGGERFLVGFLVAHATFGLSLTLVFNLAHATELAEHPAVEGDPPAVPDEWAAHEMRTTANFGPRDPVLDWFAGGLNRQIEHHLFPTWSHTLYPRIAPIVRAAARDHGLPYHEHPTYADALASHRRFLRGLARRGTAPAPAPA